MGKSRENKMMVTVPSQYISSGNDYMSIRRRQELPIKLANKKNTVCFQVRMTLKKTKAKEGLIARVQREWDLRSGHADGADTQDLARAALFFESFLTVPLTFSMLELASHFFYRS
jgi:hypothetical protein